MTITIPPLLCRFDEDIENILFPKTQPLREGHLKVSDVHSIWYAEYGNPEGKPVVFLHGGPAFGFTPHDMRFFDPTFYRIILFDQRGAMRSLPFGEMKENNTQNLIDDIEQLRKFFGIDKWLVFGGSWGSALSMLYGQAHPERCLGFILRGIFLGTNNEGDHLWYGMRDLFPESYDEMIRFLPPEERQDIKSAFYDRLMNPDPEIHMPAARAFMKYDVMCARMFHPSYEVLELPKILLGTARTFAYYSMNRFFLRENQILEEIGRIVHLPAVIIHGRYDAICRAKKAFELYQNWPGSKLILVQDAGHSSLEPGITKALVQATEDAKKSHFR